MNPAAGTPTANPKAFRTFAEFYSFHLGEHADRTCRRLQFLGSPHSFMGDWVMCKDIWTGRIKF